MSFPIFRSSGCSELAPHNCPGSWCGAGRSPKALGNGSVSVFWILTIKERTKKKPGQMAALVKAEDMGETGMRMRDCMEEAGAAGDL